VSAQTSLGAENNTEGTKAVSPLVRTTDRVRERRNITRKKDTAASQESSEVSTHVEQGSSTFDRLSESGNAAAWNVAMVGQCVQAGADTTLIRGERVLVFIAWLREPLQARDSRGTVVREGMLDAVTRAGRGRVAGASGAALELGLSTSGLEMGGDVGVELGSLTLLLGIEGRDELDELWVALDHLHGATDAFLVVRLERREGGRQREEREGDGEEGGPHRMGTMSTRVRGGGGVGWGRGWSRSVRDLVEEEHLGFYAQTNCSRPIGLCVIRVSPAPGSSLAVEHAVGGVNSDVRHAGG
jgi:hypothetical protein